MLAVQHDPEIPLQILAGPGSGKTKVLTSRIAHLVLNCSFSPWSICAVTFTNKAANEMRERLIKLIGKQRTAELKMGTFHALCATFLRKYAKAVGLDGNFTICDAEESKKLIAKILKSYQEYLAFKEMTLKEGTVMSMISKAKAKGHSAAAYKKRIQGDQGKEKNVMDEINAIVAEIYDSYEQTLRKNNSLDFDDLLLFGLKLFSTHKQAVSWCQHVLVDEFQDTNTTQYDLMRAIAVTERITIVGDPDQSIYGWRSAEVENLAKMQKDFPSTVQIFLEENYRSTAAILRTSLAIVSEDKTRVQKSLHTSNPTGANPVLSTFQTEHDEAAFIATEIKRIIANMGGTLSWGDFAVLLRFNALSRAVESALQKEGIPSRVLGGHKFFERLEIKDLLAYLQLIDNPSYDPAFVRSVGVPSRGIGEKTLVELAAKATKLKLSQFEVAEKISIGRIPDIKPSAKRKLEPFVKVIRTLRELAAKRTSPADLIRRLLDLIDYDAHLKKTQPDWETRWENVQELISFATEAEVHAPQDSNVIVILDDDEENQKEEELDTPLRLFLQASMLSSEGDDQSEDNKEKVIISTCHAAKGLEWPVVIVPSVEEGTFPFYRTEDVEEERRLLYVACTRAQSLLYLTYAAKRKVAGDAQTKELSSFISAVTKRCPVKSSASFSSMLCFSQHIRSTVANVLGRALPDEAEINRRLAELFVESSTYSQIFH
ncbi:P-loop containing nucleoside triphosphate hydrolase protein [Cyathus striatus]|nr:P-loop containing nucleoside triphosphate hydrolase protein [Cyathus striatus]